jgi:hypothetical protein
LNQRKAVSKPAAPWFSRCFPPRRSCARSRSDQLASSKGGPRRPGDNMSALAGTQGECLIMVAAGSEAVQPLVEDFHAASRSLTTGEGCGAFTVTIVDPSDRPTLTTQHEPSPREIVPSASDAAGWSRDWIAAGGSTWGDFPLLPW